MCIKVNQGVSLLLHDCFQKGCMIDIICPWWLYNMVVYIYPTSGSCGLVAIRIKTRTALNTHLLFAFNGCPRWPRGNCISFQSSELGSLPGQGQLFYSSRFFCFCCSLNQKINDTVKALVLMKVSAYISIFIETVRMFQSGSRCPMKDHNRPHDLVSGECPRHL